MPKTYIPAPHDVRTFADEVMRKYHPHVIEAGVTVNYLMVFAARGKDDKPTGVAIKLHGVPCHAVIKVNGLKDRVEGKADVTVFVDGDGWKEWTPAKREAVLTHEHEHIELTGEEDDIGRPKVKLKPHDFEIGGFVACVERHQDDCVELKQLKAAVSLVVPALKQGTFNWG